MNNSESSQKLKIGDVVQLKSDGPLMTIEEYKNGNFICQWFWEGEVNRGYFPPDSLRLVVKKKGTVSY